MRFVAVAGAKLMRIGCWGGRGDTIRELILELDSPVTPEQ